MTDEKSITESEADTSKSAKEKAVALEKEQAEKESKKVVKEI